MCILLFLHWPSKITLGENFYLPSFDNDQVLCFFYEEDFLKNVQKQIKIDVFCPSSKFLLSEDFLLIFLFDWNTKVFTEFHEVTDYPSARDFCVLIESLFWAFFGIVLTGIELEDLVHILMLFLCDMIPPIMFVIIVVKNHGLSVVFVV